MHSARTHTYTHTHTHTHTHTDEPEADVPIDARTHQATCTPYAHVPDTGTRAANSAYANAEHKQHMAAMKKERETAGPADWAPCPVITNIPEADNTYTKHIRRDNVRHDVCTRIQRMAQPETRCMRKNCIRTGTHRRADAIKHDVPPGEALFQKYLPVRGRLGARGWGEQGRTLTQRLILLLHLGHDLEGPISRGRDVREQPQEGASRNYTYFGNL